MSCAMKLKRNEIFLKLALSFFCGSTYAERILQGIFKSSVQCGLDVNACNENLSH